MRQEELAKKKSISAAVAVENSPFAGPVPVAFRSVMSAWKRIYGDLPVVELTGNALIAEP
jgi:hypothetical protein